MEFIKHNALLIGLALGSGLMLLWPLLGVMGASAVTISVTEAVLLINRNKALIVDVRDAQAYAAGHLLGARHIPLAELLTRKEELVRYRDKPVLLVCQNGSQSRAASRILKGEQFTQLHLLKGGLHAWAEAHMPLGH